MAKIELEDKKILAYLTDKEALITEGREISKMIEDLETQIESLNNQEKVFTANVEPKDLIAEGEKIKNEINKKIGELEIIGNKIMQMKIDAIPAEMKDQHHALRQKKEKLERDRNKIALKVQKIKDRVIPIIKKAIAPQLQEYEDIETAKIEDKKVVITIYSRLEDFKAKFKKK